MYKLIANSSDIIRIADGSRIPAISSNRDYADYLIWVEEGHTPDLADPPSAVELRAQQDMVDAAAARQNNKLKALSSMTPSQVEAWVADHVTNLSQAQDAIATLAIAVSVLDRRL